MRGVVPVAPLHGIIGWGAYRHCIEGPALLHVIPVSYSKYCWSINQEYVVGRKEYERQQRNGVLVGTKLKPEARTYAQKGVDFVQRERERKLSFFVSAVCGFLV